MTPLQRLEKMIREHDQQEKYAAELEAAKQAVSAVDHGLDPRLHDYQVRAVQHIHENPRAGLFLDMGLGKTAVVLQAITDEHKPVLVTAPKRVAERVWLKERDKWQPNLSMVIAAGSPAKRAEALKSGADVVVIGRDNIKDVPPGLFKTIVIDELSGFKSRQSQRWKIAKEITKRATYVWGLTGTPTPNGYLDLWPQMFLLDRGERLNKNITHYRGRYFAPGNTVRVKNRYGQVQEVVTEYLLRPGADKRINTLIEDICLSMTSEDYLDLPPTTKRVVQVPLPPRVARTYHDLEETLVAHVGDGQVHTASGAAVLTGKLSQITAGFLYGDVNEGEPEITLLHDEKIKAIQEIVDGTGSPVLVFYRFRKGELLRLKEALPQARTIDEKNVQDDWDAGKVPILLAHPQSAGHGLNLQDGGHTIIWATTPWSLEEYEQGNDRLDRQGQKYPVMIHHLVAPGTIDEAIMSRQAEKKSVQDALMEYLNERNRHG